MLSQEIGSYSDKIDRQPRDYLNGCLSCSFWHENISNNTQPLNYTSNICSKNIQFFTKHFFGQDPLNRFWYLFRQSLKMLICAALIVVDASINIISANDSLHSQFKQPTIRTQAPMPRYESARLPTSTLNLILTGTISGSPQKALISVDGRNEESFNIDQVITNDIFLVGVNLRNAVVRHNGELEKLELVSDTGFYQIDPASTDSNPLVIAAVSPSESELAWYQENRPPDKSHSYMGIQFEYSDFLTQAKLITDATGGMKISESVPGGLYERLGLQDGDNVRSINDKPFNSIFDLMDMSQQMGVADTINVAIIRNGNLYDLELDPKHGIEFRMVVNPE